jgi:microcystin-dependent protein
MAGTLPGIPLSQQFSAIGQPLAGCLLYIYAANTTTPQDSFLDQGLTLKNPWPLAGDNSGRVPMFYLADGSVHVRLTDSGGVVQFDYPSMLVIGPSTGGGGGGGSVDPTTIFQAGDVIWLDQSGTRTGWVRDNGRTLGNAVSGASERANADCQALFVFLWGTYTNTICPVVGGRGANGLADFTAGKQITLPDKRGFSPVGDTAMGNADTARLAGVPFSQGNATTAGSQGGEATHLLATTEMPSHKHPAFISDPTHAHTTTANNLSISYSGSGGNNSPQFQAGFGTGASLTGVRVWDGATFDTTAAVGGGGPHNVTSLCIVGSFYRKL